MNKELLQEFIIPLIKYRIAPMILAAAILYFVYYFLGIMYVLIAVIFGVCLLKVMEE